MTRYFNAKAEFSLTDDKLQKKFFKALQGGDSDGIKLTVEKIEVSKDVYFEMSGWDLESGNPSADLFAELGIE